MPLIKIHRAGWRAAGATKTIAKCDIVFRPTFLLDFSRYAFNFFYTSRELNYVGKLFHIDQ